ncbi:MAG: DUF2786 domain-containing protein [Dysgonomonas sp.]
MEKREKIKLKIKALLAKTTENGASEQEAISALRKAQELMLENFISEHEIKDPYLAEKCIFKKIDKIQSNYNLTVFLGCLSDLFDCEHYFSQKTVTFFGFEEDTELCAYFYSFIIKACFAEKDKYLKSDEYKRMKTFYSGRTLAASFIRGFLVAISRKMQEMYKARKQQVSHEVGLMVVDKINKVQEQFKQQNIKLRNVTSSGNYEAAAYHSGAQKGNEVSLTQGINNSNKERTLMLD